MNNSNGCFKCILIFDITNILPLSCFIYTSIVLKNLEISTGHYWYSLWTEREKKLNLQIIKWVKTEWSLVLIQKLKGDVYEAVWKNAVKVVNSDQQAFHEVCYGRVASFVTSEMNSVNNYCKMISVSHLYFSSWSSSGLVKDFPCKHLIDITYVLLHFYQACLDRKELLLDFQNRPSYDIMHELLSL